MPPEDRFVSRFAAEPPQEPLPYGRWEEALAEQFRKAAAGTANDIGQMTWFPDRSLGGRTYVPVTAPADDGEVCGYVPHRREHDGAQAKPEGHHLCGTGNAPAFASSGLRRRRLRDSSRPSC